MRKYGTSEKATLESLSVEEEVAEDSEDTVEDDEVTPDEGTTVEDKED